MIRLHRIASLVLLLLCAACGSGGYRPSVRIVSGCWALAGGDSVGGSLLTAMPDRLVFDTAPMLNPDGRPHPWRFAAPDSITVLLHANMALSWQLSLRARGDSLVGVAHRYSDYGGDSAAVPVVARRATCPRISQPVA